MGVHVSSVIDTDIQAFDSALYTAITDKEEECYDNGSPYDETEYGPKFTELSDSIIAWMETDRDAKVKELINTIYIYLTFGALYGTSTALTSQLDETDLLTMDGFRARIQTDALGYYKDYNGSTSPNIDADVALIDAAIATQEEVDMDNLISQMQVVVSTKHHDLLFQDEEVVGALTKEEMREDIFDDLNWGNAFDNLAGISLPNPPKVIYAPSSNSGETFGTVILSA